MLNLDNLKTVIQEKVNALGATATDKDLLLLSKAIEATAGNITVSSIIEKGAVTLVEIDQARQSSVANVGAAGDQAVHDVSVAGNQKIAEIQGVFDPTAYVKKQSMQSYTFESVDLDSLNTVGETRYVDASHSLGRPAGSVGYGYYMGLAGGDAGGLLGLQALVDQAGKFFWRDKYAGGWREFWHTGNVTISDAAVGDTVAKRTPGGALYATDLSLRTGAASGQSVLYLGSDADALDAYFQMNGSGNGNLAGPRSVSMVINTGAFGLYANRLAPSLRMFMDASTGQFTFYKSVNSDPVAAPFASTIALNFAASNRFDLVATGNFTLANPSGMKPGQVVVLNVTCQNANTVMSTGSVFKTRGGAGAALSLTAGANDKVVMECVSAGRIDISVQQDWK